MGGGVDLKSTQDLYIFVFVLKISRYGMEVIKVKNLKTRYQFVCDFVVQNCEKIQQVICGQKS